MVHFYACIRIFLFLTFGLVAGSGLAHAQYWSPDTTGLNVPIGSLAIDANGVIFAGAELFNRGGGVSPEGVYRSSDNGQTWSKSQNPTNSFGDAVTLGPIMGINPKGINPAGDIFSVGGDVEFRSTDDGDTWQEIQLEPHNTSDPPILAFTALTVGSTGTCNLFIATGASGIYVSTNDGNNWGDEGNILDSLYPFATYVASTPWGAIFQASATGLERGKGMDGESFDSTIPGTPSLEQGIEMASNATGLIVAGGTSGLYFTLDTGNYWAPITPPWATVTRTYYILAVNGNGYIYVGTNSIDGRQGGVSLSKDTGRSWQNISSGLVTDTINAFAFNNNGELFCATDNGVFKYNPSGSGVKTTISDVPSSLILEQNTPNPFASSTNIRFSVPESGPVSLKVFDPTGREVGTVVSGSYSPGTYSTSFNAESLPDGAYYYRLEAGGQTAARMFVVEH